MTTRERGHRVSHRSISHTTATLHRKRSVLCEQGMNGEAHSPARGPTPQRQGEKGGASEGRSHKKRTVAAHPSLFTCMREIVTSVLQCVHISNVGEHTTWGRVVGGTTSFLASTPQTAKHLSERQKTVLRRPCSPAPARGPTSWRDGTEGFDGDATRQRPGHTGSRASTHTTIRNDQGHPRCKLGLDTHPGQDSLGVHKTKHATRGAGSHGQHPGRPL